MHKIYSLVLALLLVNISLTYANNSVDSIGVENNKGKKLIVHKVEAKETYYSIGKKYHVNYKDVLLYNENKSLQIGVIIKVPTELPFITADVASNATNAAVIEYTIKAKDNLNMLAEKYGTTVNEIKRVNNLNSINLQIGQVLKIPINGATIPTETSSSVNQTTAEVNTPTTNSDTPSEHVIKAKENLNLIAEKYGTTVDELKKLNGLSSSNLRIGQVLRIPSATAVATTAAIEAPVQTIVNVPEPKKLPKQQTVPSTVLNDGSFEHTVVAGETIYSIAKKYSLTTYQLKTFNNLAANEVSAGQKLIIKGTRPAVANDEETEPGTNTIKDPSLRYSPSTYGIVQLEEKGTAVWIDDASLDAAKMLVLHRTAPIGTIIKVTNPMSNRSAFAKVVGKFTENETTKDVIIVMTKAVAESLQALDKRFFCNITYGPQANEQ